MRDAGTHRRGGGARMGVEGCDSAAQRDIRFRRRPSTGLGRAHARGPVVGRAFRAGGERDRVMIGITGYSTYVPLHRLRRETIAAAWNVKAAPGCKAVANWDEDALTMGQAAAWRIVPSGQRPEALYFASTSAPYWQRSSSGLIAAACDLPASVATADFGGSLRAGASA